MSLRIGMLTSGGDCQGLNPTMRGVAKALFEKDPGTEILGFLDGYAGLMHCHYRKMRSQEFSGILTLGGTILGTSRQPYKLMEERLYPGKPDGPTKIEAMVNSYKEMRLDALVVLGGNGSLKSASLLADQGLNVIGLPKTIDNDLGITEETFGFNSAFTLATQVIDGIHTTATSHGRVFIIEIMGHKVGWLALYSGIAGGADIILLPEIPYKLNSVLKAINTREKHKKRFSIIVIAEGAMTVEEAQLSSKELETSRAARGFRGACYDLEDAMEGLALQEVRVAVPGHFVRGGSPSAYDRLLSTELGVEAAKMIWEKDFGRMPVVINGRIDRTEIKTAAFNLKKVPLDSPIIEAARLTGISFGDED